MNIYLFSVNDGLECRHDVREYFDYYNNECLHQEIDGQPPFTVYEQQKAR